MCRPGGLSLLEGKDPPQHNSQTTSIMSAEGKIKMKKSRSSGEVRRQQDFTRPIQTDDESKEEEKQNSSDLKLQSRGAGRPTENTWMIFDESLVIMCNCGIVSIQIRLPTLPSWSLSWKLVITADQNRHILETAASELFMAA